MSERFYAVVRESDGYYYSGGGNFSASVLQASRFFTYADAVKAKDSLNSQGYCDGSCAAKEVYVDYPSAFDEVTETNMIDPSLAKEIPQGPTADP